VVPITPLFLSLVCARRQYSRWRGYPTDTATDNLDHELAAFLKKWFPDEVKNKQRYNELQAGVDQYGEVYASQKCVVM
jgi:hypothetical protein